MFWGFAQDWITAKPTFDDDALKGVLWASTFKKKYYLLSFYNRKYVPSTLRGTARLENSSEVINGGLYHFCGFIH